MYIIVMYYSLTLCMLCNFVCFFDGFFFNLFIFSFKLFKKSYRNTINVKSVDQYQAQHFVDPDLGPTACKIKSYI